MAAKQENPNSRLDEKLVTLEIAVEKAKDLRFEDYNSRLSDQNKFYRQTIYLIGFIFVLVQFFLLFNQITNLSEQKEDIQRFKKNINEEISAQLGKTSKKPIIELYSHNGGLIYDQSVIEGTVELHTASKKELEIIKYPYLFDSSSKYKKLRLRFGIKNIGEVIVYKVTAVLYTNKPIINISSALRQEENYTSIDGFNYMTGGPQFNINLPPGLSDNFIFSLRLPNDFDPTLHKDIYPVIVKIHYGGNEIVEKKFNLRINSKIKVIPFATDHVSKKK